MPRMYGELLFLITSALFILLLIKKTRKEDNFGKPKFANPCSYNYFKKYKKNIFPMV